MYTSCIPRHHYRLRALLNTPEPIPPPCFLPAQQRCVSPPKHDLIMSPAISNTLGAIFISFAFSSVVFGVNTTQVITYLQRYPEDRLVYKFLVATVWVLNCLDQALIGHSVYFYTIENFADPFVLVTEPVIWTLIAQLTVGAVIGTIVRLCFAMRVWRFSQRNYFVTGAVIVLALGELGIAIVFTLRCFENPFISNLPRLKLLASFSLGTGVVADVFTAAALCFFLRRFRTGSNQRADNLVNTLTIYAINTGAFTATISLLTLIFYDRSPDTFQFIAFYFILSKLYPISFLCTLNTRKIIRGKGTDREQGPTTRGSETNNNPNHMTSNVSNRFYLSNAPRPEYPFPWNAGYPTSEPMTSISKESDLGVRHELRSVSSDAETVGVPRFANPVEHPYAYMRAT
ncbi:hypothetical protein FB45DRAFT_934939 [Roridomyces roridus]|uniref:DUF6534 domain-containing protein n=1 Tax=Roridomyces roridus TaxID=1738132 RepID=A0AAD7BBP8_9AGAR|nr:hypothetical protein FB45DRAFT_934939 [Roridomyces roridus]